MRSELKKKKKSVEGNKWHGQEGMARGKLNTKKEGRKIRKEKPTLLFRRRLRRLFHPIVEALPCFVNRCSKIPTSQTQLGSCRLGDILYADSALIGLLQRCVSGASPSPLC